MHPCVRAATPGVKLTVPRRLSIPDRCSFGRQSAILETKSAMSNIECYY